jgi:lipopolysaccharide export system permease protein
MIKKLDKLVFKAFIGPFIITFFIAFFILMMQSLWKYIDDLVGKDLDLITVGKFLWYASASLLILAIPIAILISSIMAFGNLGESFELVAIKSSGISLLRFMRPLIFFSAFLCIVSFFFANNVIPIANLQFKTLYYDIVFKKPALDLKEGKFYTQIPGYAIKVGKKDKDQKTIHNVMIFEMQSGLQDNSIVAEQGVMGISPDKKYLEFTLQNGCRYQERGNVGDTSTEFIQVGFKEYKKLFDLSALQMKKTSDTVFKNDSRMLTLRQLNRNIDSVKKVKDSFAARLKRETLATFKYSSVPDSTWKKAAPIKKAAKDFNSLIPDSAKQAVNSLAIGMANSLKSTFQFTGGDWEGKQDEVRFSEIEWHRKFSFSMACLVLFFIGAPLGSIIRKGGLGMPLVVAIIFFILFHLLNIFGEKFAREDVTSVVVGMWMAVAVLIPVGAFFTYKAMHDSQLFNKEFYYRFFKSFGKLFKPIVNRLSSNKTIV